jgi:uncharacterized lipoprotein YajG
MKLKEMLTLLLAVLMLVLVGCQAANETPASTSNAEQTSDTSSDNNTNTSPATVRLQKKDNAMICLRLNLIIASDGTRCCKSM